MRHRVRKVHAVLVRLRNRPTIGNTPGEKASVGVQGLNPGSQTAQLAGKVYAQIVFTIMISLVSVGGTVEINVLALLECVQSQNWAATPGRLLVSPPCVCVVHLVAASSVWKVSWKLRVTRPELRPLTRPRNEMPSPEACPRGPRDLGDMSRQLATVREKKMYARNYWAGKVLRILTIGLNMT